MKPKRRRGRPRKDLGAPQVRQIEVLAGYGLTEAAIAAVLGLGDRTFREKKQADARISAALEKGRARAEMNVAKALYHRALRGELGAIIWWEKTRAGRRDGITVNLDPDHGVLRIPLEIGPDRWLEAAARQQEVLPGKPR